MLKTRTLTLTAVVAVGAIALGAPTLAGANPGPASPASISDQIAKLKQAGKSAKSRAHTSSKWSKGIDTSIDRTNTAITRLGNNVYDLRKANDMTNWTLSSIASAAISALTQLQAGLVGLAASYTNFEYGVVQLGTDSGGTFTAIPGAFVATPRLDPTVEQSTVTAQFPCLGAPLPLAARNGCTVGNNIRAQVAVRSASPTANDAKSTAKCRVTVSQGVRFVTTIPQGGVPATTVARSALVPTDPAELQIFPLSMVSTDTQVNATTDGTNSSASFTAANTYPGVGSVSEFMLLVTLSCLSIPNPA